MPILTALQLYSVRDEMEEDFYGTIKDVKEMGYDGVEFAGLFDQDPSVIRDFLKEIELIPISAHVPLSELMGDTEAVVAAYKKIGCKYIAIPYLTEDLRPGTDGFADTVNNIKEIGRICASQGVQLLYHNHDFEFVTVDGEYGLDRLYRLTTPEELMTELDTCWVNVGGENPAAYIEKYAGRSPVVHLKDFYMKSRDQGGKLYELIGIEDDVSAQEDNFTFMPVGYGMQDIPAIMQASRNAGAEWVVVEQDRPDKGRTPLEDAKLSIDYLKTL